MTRASRRRLFYSLVLVFLIIGTGVVGYAEGWRIDFKTWRFEKVGEIFVRSYPVDASITLDRKSIQNQSGFLSRGTLIPDLIPRSYDLILSEPGYAPWHENASVQKSLVTQFKYAVLVPRNGTTTIEGPIKDALLTSDGIIAEYPNGSVRNGTTTIAQGSVTDMRSANPAIWANITVHQPNGTYVWYSLNGGGTVNLSSLFLRNGVDLRNASTVVEDRYDADNPYEANLEIAQNLSKIWILDEVGGTLAFTAKASSGTVFPPSIATAPDAIAWPAFSVAKDNSVIDVFEPSSQSEAASPVTVPGRTVAVQWIHGGDFGVLQDDGSLYDYDAGQQTFAKVADNVTSFSASSDGVMLAAVELSSFEAFDRSTQDYYRFNLPEAATVIKAIWYRDDSHLFIVYPDHVSFLDLNDSSLENLTTVAAGTAPFYDAAANALYVVNASGSLIRFDFPS